MKLILHGLGLAPLTELVLQEPDHAASGGVPLFSTPYPEPVEPGGVYSSVLVVEEGDPRVNLLDGLMLVDMIWWGGTVVSEPYKLRGGQQAGNHQLVLDMRMVSILCVNYLLQTDKPANDKVPVPTPDQVIQSSRHEDPHGSHLSLEVIDEGISEVTDGASRDGHPLNMEGVCRTGYCGVKWTVDIMEETVSKADIQTCVWPGVVDHHAGGAHVGAVVELGGKVHSLSDPNLPCREVAMVHTFLRA